MKKHKYGAKIYFIAIVVLVLLLSCFTAFATETTNIEWTTDHGEVILADDLNQEIYDVNHKSLNNVTVSFNHQNKGIATLLILPVTNGATEELTERKVIYMAQAPVEQGEARFSFYLTSDIQDGIYSLMVGGIETGYSARYFKVNTKQIPKIKYNQVIQYDDYKEKIMLEFEDDSDENDIVRISQDENTSVRLSYGEKSVDIQKEDIFYDVENKIITINTQNYADIFPTIDEKPDGNIQWTTISITNPEFWGDETVGGVSSRTFGLVIKEVSAEGFDQGLPFELKLYSYDTLAEVTPIIAVYDDGKLVHAIFGKEVTLEAEKEMVVPITLKCSDIKPSGKFTIKVLLWQGTDITPLTSIVKFP